MKDEENKMKVTSWVVNETVEENKKSKRNEREIGNRNRLKNKLENRRLNSNFRHSQLKKLKLRVGMHKIRSKFQNRVKNSINQNVNKKQFKPFVQSIVLKIELNSVNDASKLLTQQNKAKSIITIPLYVEVFSEWSSKSDDIFRKIGLIIRKFSLNNINDWEQIEFDLNDLTIRLSSSSKAYCMINDYQKSKVNPIFVKILRLNKDDKLNYVNKIKFKNEFNLVKPTCEKKFDKFLTYTSSIGNNNNSDDTNVVKAIASNSLSSDISKSQAANKIENVNILKSLPRLLCRKRSNLHSKLHINEIKKDDGHKKTGLHNNNDTTKIDKLSDDDSIPKITPFLCKFRPKEYSNMYYDPFKDEKLVLPLYQDFGRHFIDEVSDILNNMIKGVCLYDDQLKTIERKRIETEEKNRKFLNFTQKILNDTKIMALSSGITTNSNNLASNSLASINIGDAKNKQPIQKSLSIFNKEKAIYSNVQQPLNTTNVLSTYSSIPNKRITPILPKLPPCIKIITNKAENDNKINLNMNTGNSISTLSSSNNIITKLLSKSNSLPVTQSSNNQLINTKIFSTSSVNHKTQIITTNSNTSCNVTNSNLINIDLRPKITSTSKCVASKDDSQQFKTFVKLVSFENNNTGNKDNDSTIGHLKHNLQLVKVSSKIPNLVNKNESDSSIRSNSIINNNSKCINLNSNTETDQNINLNKIFIKSPQKVFNNMIISPVNSNNHLKPIYKILPKNNEIKETNYCDIKTKTHVNLNGIMKPKINTVNNLNSVNLVNTAAVKETQSIKIESDSTSLINLENTKDSYLEVKDTTKLTESLIAMRKRKRKQDFSELLHKCVSNNLLNKLTTNEITSQQAK